MPAAALAHSYTVTGVDHALPWWARALFILAIVVYVVLLVAGVIFVTRASRRLSRLAKIAVGIVAVYAIVGVVTVFIQLYHGSDLWGSALASSFIVAYALVAAGVVLALDWAVRRFRGRSVPLAAEPLV